MINKQQWLRRYMDELLVDFDNTTKEEYETFYDFTNAMWESYNESQTLTAIDRLENK